MDKTFDLEFRLSKLKKSIWIYTGYEWEYIFTQDKLSVKQWKRQQILFQCDVLIDGQYLFTQKDITLKWRGSKNQRIIDVQNSLKQNEIILY